TDAPILVHMEEVSDRLAGFIGGYLVFTNMVPEVSESIQLTERLMERALGPAGRQMITAASRIAEGNDADSEDSGAETAS
ncbi:MAG: hypothetical protein ACN4GZ_15640, partial [Acidimicrobiales bacterium]